MLADEIASIRNIWVKLNYFHLEIMPNLHIYMLIGIGLESFWTYNQSKGVTKLDNLWQENVNEYTKPSSYKIAKTQHITLEKTEDTEIHGPWI